MVIPVPTRTLSLKVEIPATARFPFAEAVTPDPTETLPLTV